MVKTRSVAYRLASTTPTTTTTMAAKKTDRGGVVETTEPSNSHSKIRCPFLEVSQKKIRISNPTEETVKGPIRLRLLRLPPATHPEETDS
mmetsp:Transcript_40983/g.96223  ORF Transcript_40983/g.96223 Transcript_40983/m.96223 type:complete len:90 (-) Transcript_40983:378-647(-)